VTYQFDFWQEGLGELHAAFVALESDCHCYEEVGHDGVIDDTTLFEGNEYLRHHHHFLAEHRDVSTIDIDLATRQVDIGAFVLLSLFNLFRRRFVGLVASQFIAIYEQVVHVNLVDMWCPFFLSERWAFDKIFV
jgi:hypothetical protein